MQEILEINSRDLTGGELDYDVVDLEAGELNINTIDLDSGALETVTVDASRIIPLERDVAELKSRGNIRYDTAQELTEEQQTQARENIDAQESISDLDEIRSNAASGASKVSNIQSDWNATTGDAAILNKPNLSNVATSGNYNDLSNKPSIPSQLSDLSSDSTHRLVSDTEKSTWNSKQDAIDDLEDIRENASAGASAYQLPNDGIPSTDLDNNVQTSLGKADTAIQVEEDPVFSASAASGITAEDIASWNEHTSNIGTITGVSVNGTSVATSGVANISSVPASILEGTLPSDLSAITQNQGDGSNKIATTSYVDTAINNLPDPMIFRGSLGTGGTITTLPTASNTNVGYTYKVIEDGTYANQSAKIGDTFISDGSAWILIPSGDEPSGTVTSIKIEANSPIHIDNDAAISTSGTRTLSHDTSGVTAGTYRAVTVNNTGHVTAGTTEAIYILTTTWGNTASQCYLRSQYFLNSLVPTQKGDLILCRGNGNLFKCGDLVYDSQEGVYYTNPTYLCNVLTSHQDISGKVDKVSSSTDNAVVRFDGTGGNLQNSGVTINDSNHVTAVKFITSGGTSSQFVKGDGSLDGVYRFKEGDAILSNSIFASKNSLYVTKTDNTLYSADKRYTVTHKLYDSNGNFVEDLSTNIFDGNYEHASAKVKDNYYAEVYIGIVAEEDLANTNLYISAYNSGKLILSFYNNFICSGMSAQLYTSVVSGTTQIGWHTLNPVVDNNIKGSYDNVYSISVSPSTFVAAYKIRYDGKTTSNYGASLCQIEHFCTRVSIERQSVVTKYPVAQDLWGEVTAPKFITRNGTSSQFVKGNGTLDSTSYAPLASPALTGTPTAPTATAGTNTTQVATTAFVDTAVSGKANKSEMSVVAGTGTNADKTTITLKSGTSATVLTTHQDISGKQDVANLVTSISSISTDAQYPSAKCVYDLVGNIETLLASI